MKPLFTLGSKYEGTLEESLENLEYILLGSLAVHLTNVEAVELCCGTCNYNVVLLPNPTIRIASVVLSSCAGPVLTRAGLKRPLQRRLQAFCKSEGSTVPCGACSKFVLPEGTASASACSRMNRLFSTFQQSM